MSPAQGNDARTLARTGLTSFLLRHSQAPFLAICKEEVLLPRGRACLTGRRPAWELRHRNPDRAHGAARLAFLGAEHRLPLSTATMVRAGPRVPRCGQSP